MDLERLFSVAASSAVTANEVFTNRVMEKELFSRTVLETPWSGSDLIDLVVSPTMPRRNVLVYYGMGGIGKSTLSKELQRSLSDQEFSSFDNVAVARIDFSELSSVDVEIMLLRLRASFGRLTPHFPAFDMALATYWERKHPGESLADFLGRRSSLGRLTADAGLAEQIQSSLDTLAGGFGLVGTAWRLGSLLKDGAVKRVTERRILKECPFFEPLMTEAVPDKTRPFLPALLAWDLANRQKSSSIAAVVFLDTWESVQEGHSDMGGMEDAVNRLVYLMPNVLFVVTGRNRLDWAKSSRATTVKYAGVDRWPGLVEQGSSAQFLVGGLSPSDSDEYLRERLTAAHAPAIPDDIRERIVAASDGMPLYLELSAEHFDEMLSRGTPDPEDFGVSLPQLVTRVIRGLDGEERRILRAAALVRAFDRNLLKAAVPGLGDASIQRFLARSFVRGDRQGWLQYSLHDVLRQSIREFDEVSPDPWSEDEWREAARRISVHLERSCLPDLEGMASIKQDRPGASRSADSRNRSRSHAQWRTA